jgi:hypothetical protein
VELLADGAIGQWFYVDRESGKLRWARSFGRPNTVDGVSDGIIIASERRSDGPWAFNFGIYGIELETGKLRWVSHGDGWTKGLLRLLDFVPAFTNELRDAPLRVSEGECLTDRGRVLDVQTGHLKRREVVKKASHQRKPETVPWRALYFEGQCNLGELGHLERNDRTIEGDAVTFHSDSSLVFRLIDPGGQERWSFSPLAHGVYSGTNAYASRYEGGFLYLVVSEKPASYRSPARFSLWTLRVETGEVVQKVSLGDDPFEEARIEDMDAANILISGDRTLFCFDRV